MVQWEGQSFKSIFLSISTTCRVWFQEGGTGSGTDLSYSPTSFSFTVVLLLMRKAAHFLCCVNDRILSGRQAGSDPSRHQRI